MKRKGQLLTMDALLSLVIVVMVVGVVMNTNDMIKAEITNLLDWYDRANIANNMLDVLTKSPGYPGDWENNVTDVRMIGLRNKDTFALDYEKIIALNRSKEDLKEFLNRLARGKDFLFEVYVSGFNVSISGGFPKVFLNNITLANPNPPPAGVKFSLDKANGGEVDKANGGRDQTFNVSYIQIRKANGTVYENGEICKLGEPIMLKDGDYVRFTINESVALKVDKVYNRTLQPPATIEFYYKKGDQASQFKISFSPQGHCWNDLRIETGGGTVVLLISGYEGSFPTLNIDYKTSRNLYDEKVPLYRFALINGSFETDNTVIRSSMSRSPWIQPAERLTSITNRIYNLSRGPSPKDPLVYGIMEGNIPENALLKIRVNSSSGGNLTLISMLEDEKRGLFVQGNGTIINATLVWFVNGQGKAKTYESIGDVIILPLKDFLGTANTKNKFIGVWLYSMSDTWRGNVDIEIVPPIDHLLGPKIDDVLIKLLVWDDR